MRFMAQASLDDLAAAWSAVDRSRPRTRAEVPGAIASLGSWISAALTVDVLLDRALGVAYRQIRGEDRSGTPLLGLQEVLVLLQAGHHLEEVVEASAEPEHLFWELYWRPLPRLPAAPAGAGEPEQRAAYEAHLAARAARRTAAAATIFLLRVAGPLGADSRQLEERRP